MSEKNAELLKYYQKLINDLPQGMALLKLVESALEIQDLTLEKIAQKVGITKRYARMLLIGEGGRGKKSASVYLQDIKSFSANNKPEKDDDKPHSNFNDRRKPRRQNNAFRKAS